MTQEERWLIHYNEVKTFIEENHRNPSKYVDSERGLRNWVKHKKLLNAGALEGQRLMMFNVLLALGEKYKRVNRAQRNQLYPSWRKQMYRLWTYRDDLDLSLLDDRLRRMGVMPVEAMPFYSSSALIRWKVRRILAFVLMDLLFRSEACNFTL